MEMVRSKLFDELSGLLEGLVLAIEVVGSRKRFKPPACALALHNRPGPGVAKTLVF